MKLGAIAQEAAACRAAWADHSYDPEHPLLAWHLHHEVLAEFLREPAENRIAYIIAEKPKEEQALRLRLFRPAIEPVGDAAYDKARAAYDKAWAASVEASAASVEASAAYVKASAAYVKASAAYVKAGAATTKAWAAYDKARAAYDKAWAASVKAWAAYDKASAATTKARAPLHASECPDCPWDGKSIFGTE